MGYCYRTNCYYDCCNYYGYCPEDYFYSYSSLQNSCWTYYQNTAGSTIGIAVGASIAGLIIIIIAYTIYRRRQQAALEQQLRMASMNNTYNDGTTVVIAQPQQQQPIYGQPYPTNPGYFGQPAYGQPVYGQNYAPPEYGQPGYYANQQPQPIIITNA